MKRRYLTIPIAVILFLIVLTALTLLLHYRFYPQYPLALDIFIAFIDTFCAGGFIYILAKNNLIDKIL